MATGRQGTSRLMHRAAAPGLKLPISPVRERVPSGKSSSGTPSSSRLVASPLPTAQAGPVDREGVEEQGGQAFAPPDVEEVVGGGTGGDVARQLPGQGTDDQRGVEMAGVVGHHHVRSADRLEVLPAEHRDGDHPPDSRFEHPSLRDKSRTRMQRRGVAATARHVFSLSRPPLPDRGQARASGDCRSRFRRVRQPG